MSALRETSQNVAAAPARNFKNRALGVEDGRARRRDNTVQLRKSNRDEQLMKRRNVQHEDDDEEEANLPPVDAKTAAQNLTTLCDNLFSNDAEVRFKSIQTIRKMLSKDRDPPIGKVIDAGAVPRIVQLLGDFGHPNVQFEAAWALTNIASGTSAQTATVLDNGGVQAFVALLGSTSEEVKDQSVWALGNIAGDSEMFRDYVLSCQALPPLLQLLGSSCSVSLMRNAVWALSNLCRGKKPAPDFAVVRLAIPTLARIIYTQDKETLADACWALSYLSDGDDKLRAVIESGVVPRLVELLDFPSEEVKTPALRALGNIVTGNEMETQVVLNAGALVPLAALLRESKAMLRKEAAWALSNIGAGNTAQIQALLDGNVVPLLLHMVVNDEPRVQKEATWAVVNMLQGGKDEQIRFLVRQGAISPLVGMLKVGVDVALLKLVLDGIARILKVGSGSLQADYAVYVEEAGGLDKLEALQEHQNEAVYKKSFAIITEFFSEDAEGDEENIAPVATSTAYQFQSMQQPTGTNPVFHF